MSLRRSPKENVRPVILEMIPGDVYQRDEAEINRRRGNQGWSGEELQMLSCFGRKAIIKYLVMHKAACGSAQWRSVFTVGFRRQRSMIQKGSLVRSFDAPDSCGTPISNERRAYGSVQAHGRPSVSLRIEDRGRK
jgi:hypothetical protein